MHNKKKSQFALMWVFLAGVICMVTCQFSVDLWRGQKRVIVREVDSSKVNYGARWVRGAA